MKATNLHPTFSLFYLELSPHLTLQLKVSLKRSHLDLFWWNHQPFAIFFQGQHVSVSWEYFYFALFLFEANLLRKRFAFDCWKWSFSDLLRLVTKESFDFPFSVQAIENSSLEVFYQLHSQKTSLKLADGSIWV